MGRRQRDDAIDQTCRNWARERRKTLGLDELDYERDGVKRFGVGAPSSEYLGAVRSTLGQRRDLHAGSTSAGRVEQHFPEVYTGDALLVHRAYRSMPHELRGIMDLHYVARAPVESKAEIACMSLRVYWSRVREVRRFVEGWLNAHLQPVDSG